MSRRAVVAAVVALAFLAGLAAGALRPDAEEAGPRPAAPAGAPPAAPATGAAAGPPERSAEGAREAAVAVAAASQEWLQLGDDDLRGVVRALATPAAAEPLGAEAVARFREARQSLAGASGPVWWVVRPLAAAVETFDGEGAEVAVWTVTVLSAPGVAEPRAEWMRVRIGLSWSDGGWRAASVDGATGPTPAPGGGEEPWTAEAFGRALDGYVRLGPEGSP